MTVARCSLWGASLLVREAVSQTNLLGNLSVEASKGVVFYGIADFDGVV